MDALGVAGDVSSAGAAFAGLLLVFMGSVATSYESYQRTEQKTVLGRYQRRVWFAFIGFALSVAATVLALFAKAAGNSWSANGAFIFLVIGMGFAIAAAVRAARDVR